MTTKIIHKEAFAVIGKAGQDSASNSSEWIAPLWQAANTNFSEISGIVSKNESGTPLVWGAMNDANEQNKLWGEAENLEGTVWEPALYRSFTVFGNGDRLAFGQSTQD